MICMAENNKTPKQTKRPAEQKGVVTDVVVPIAAAGVGGAAAGAANAIVSDAIKKPKKDK
jgi:hypothetical protein